MACVTNWYVFVSLSQLSTDTVKILIAHGHVGLTIYDNCNSLHNLHVVLSSYRDIQHFVTSTVEPGMNFIHYRC